MRDEARKDRSALAHSKRWLAPFRERWLAPFLCLLFALGVGWGISAQSTSTTFVATTRNGEWQSYTGDTRGWATRRSIRVPRRTSTTSRTRGGSIPTASAVDLNTNSKARR